MCWEDSALTNTDRSDAHVLTHKQMGCGLLVAKNDTNAKYENSKKEI